jgi:L-threonylcarbamoyladenylate synthase
MQTIKINHKKNGIMAINQAKKVIGDGGVVLYPTDTLYGLGVNIFDENALKKIYHLKKRSTKKPISVCVSNVECISKIAYLDSAVMAKISRILPGPFTILLKKKKGISDLLTAGSDKIGIRIPDNEICQKITEEFPITTSSANISGEETKNSPSEIINQLGVEVELILDSGPLKFNKSSTVIDFTLNPPLVMRKGAGFEEYKKISSI